MMMFDMKRRSFEIAGLVRESSAGVCCMFVQDRIKKENALLLGRITDLESRMSEFQYCGVWHDGAYKRATS